MEYRLVDDQGHDVARGTPGELLVRARGADPRAGFFSGYLNDPVRHRGRPGRAAGFTPATSVGRRG